MNKFEQFWARFTRVASFFAGMAIMAFETVSDKSDRPWIYAAAVGMMGLPIARAAEGILGRLSGTGPQVLPSEKQPQQPVAPQPIPVVQQPPTTPEGTGSGGPTS